MLALVILLIVVKHSWAASGLCNQCDCYPPEKPEEIYCDKSSTGDMQSTFFLDNLENVRLLYIYGYSSLELKEGSINSISPVTVLIYHTKNVTLHSALGSNIRFLTVAHVDYLRIKAFALQPSLYAVRLQNIRELIIEQYAIRLSERIFRFDLTNVNSIQLYESSIDISSTNTTEFRMTNCSVKSLPRNSTTLSVKTVYIDYCNFIELPTYSINITATTEINIKNNTFQNFYDNSLILQARKINIIHNLFKTLPKKTLKGMTEGHTSVFFGYNTINDIDLGGFMLYTEYKKVIFSFNAINCSCLPTITSILLPQREFPTIPEFKEIFQYNFCKSKCNMSLMTFSRYLDEGQICKNDKILLTSDDLCTMTEVTPFTNSTVNGLEKSKGLKPELYNFLLLFTLFFYKIKLV